MQRQSEDKKTAQVMVSNTLCPVAAVVVVVVPVVVVAVAIVVAVAVVVNVGHVDLPLFRVRIFQASIVGLSLLLSLLFLLLSFLLVFLFLYQQKQQHH